MQNLKNPQKYKCIVCGNLIFAACKRVADSLMGYRKVIKYFEQFCMLNLQIGNNNDHVLQDTAEFKEKMKVRCDILFTIRVSFTRNTNPPYHFRVI
jgi:hypothetical protein